MVIVTDFLWRISCSTISYTSHRPKEKEIRPKIKVTCRAAIHKCLVVAYSYKTSCQIREEPIDIIEYINDGLRSST